MYREISKEEWIALRGGPHIPAELVMEYCNKTSNAGFRNVQHFIESFNEALMFGVNPNLTCVRDYFDRKHNVEILRDKHGNEIMIR